MTQSHLGFGRNCLSVEFLHPGTSDGQCIGDQRVCQSIEVRPKDIWDRWWSMDRGSMSLVKCWSSSTGTVDGRWIMDRRFWWSVEVWPNDLWDRRWSMDQGSTSLVKCWNSTKWHISLLMVDGERKVMMCHAMSTSMFHVLWSQLMPQYHISCHIIIHVSCHIIIVSTSSNRDGRWSIVGSTELRKCFRRALGIVDHRWSCIEWIGRELHLSMEITDS